jgi:hypothetical protein
LIAELVRGSNQLVSLWRKFVVAIESSMSGGIYHAARLARERCNVNHDDATLMAT